MKMVSDGFIKAAAKKIVTFNNRLFGRRYNTLSCQSTADQGYEMRIPDLILYINGFAFERLYEERTPQFTTLTSN
jgi:hypothetical protein